jgi:hypothetical protein
VVVATCHYGIRSGIYLFSALRGGQALSGLPAPRQLDAAVFARARLAALEAQCGYTIGNGALGGFALMTQRGALGLWRRR